MDSTAHIIYQFGRKIKQPEGISPLTGRVFDIKKRRLSGIRFWKRGKSRLSHEIQLGQLPEGPSPSFFFPNWNQRAMTMMIRPKMLHAEEISLEMLPLL